MTKIETLTEATQTAARRAEYARNLLRGLGYEPQNYEYSGEILDCGTDGECACGHPIRWGFPLKHKSDAGKTKIVGSTCVGYFAEVNQELFLALCKGVDRLNEQLAQAKAASKRAAAQAEVEALAAQWQELYDSLRAEYIGYRERGEMAPRALWEAFGSRFRALEAEPPQYTRPAAYKRWYKKEIEKLRTL